MLENVAADNGELPLSGVKVLDLSRVFAGPLCGQVLADLGAEVVKVEHPVRGDDTRDWGFRIGKTETTYYNSMNRNKRSITLDLKKQEGVELLYELLPRFDVVIHNFKKGDDLRLGVDYESLARLRPDLIYCTVSGYGSNTSEADRPGYDIVVQAEAGLMAINGDETMPPLKFGVAIVDMMTGMNAAQAILAALYKKAIKGIGCRIELSLYDCGVGISGYYGLDAMVNARSPKRVGNGHPSIVPYGVFQSADGPVVIAVGNNRQFEKFCREVIFRADILEDPRFSTNIARTENKDALLAIMLDILAAMKSTTLIARMTACGIPCGLVSPLYDALTSDRTKEAGMMQAVPHGVDGAKTWVFAAPYQFNGERVPVRRSPPMLAEGTRELLGEYVGLTEAQLNDLEFKGVISLL